MAEAESNAQWDDTVSESMLAVLPHKEGVTLLDYGCGSTANYVNFFEKHGYQVTGYDQFPPAKPNCFYADFRGEPLVVEPHNYLVSVGVLQYFSLQEVLEQLSRMWPLFRERAFLFTPDSPLHRETDLRSLSVVCPFWLAWMCNCIGGTAMVLNYYNDFRTGMGPAVLWLKEDYPYSLRHVPKILDGLKEALSDETFTVSLM
jgi:hypothetical protein